MASTFSTVKLNACLVDEARREADLFHRSIAGQIEHWARLGRALENAKGFSLERVRKALAGELKIEALSDSEQDAFFSELHAQFESPSPTLTANYAELGRQRQAVRAPRRRSKTDPPGSKSAA
jgi:hypothetical protein